MNNKITIDIILRNIKRNNYIKIYVDNYSYKRPQFAAFANNKKIYLITAKKGYNKFINNIKRKNIKEIKQNDFIKTIDKEHFIKELENILINDEIETISESSNMNKKYKTKKNIIYITSEKEFMKKSRKELTKELVKQVNNNCNKYDDKEINKIYEIIELNKYKTKYPELRPNINSYIMKLKVELLEIRENHNDNYKEKRRKINKLLNILLKEINLPENEKNIDDLIEVIMY